ncbi:MAG TPA: GFA family protein [Rhodobacteraceae bacterium]|nr:GFA family protein [Paracoccaceae bacterium]
MTEGRCLCGAVRVSVAAPMTEISACHCGMCRRWSGAMQMGIEVPQDKVVVSGPIKTYRSSSFAERAWCDSCGLALWFRDVEGPNTGWFELAPGLFDNAAGAKLVREVYADRCPEGYRLEGDAVARMSQKDYEAVYPHVNEETKP